MSKDKTVKELQKEVDAYISQFKEGYFSPLAMTARLTEELVSWHVKLIIIMVKNQKKHLKMKKPLKRKWAIYCLSLFVLRILLHIDLEEAHDRVMKKFNTRDKDRWTKIDE